ncbi:MAG: hypothetical protein L0H94_08875 [Nitrospira sp.]|nr:hypothetical protein [Nitrospira sp.]
MMIVTAIIGLTATIAVPSYTGWLARAQLKEAAMMINSQLTMGRFAAMNRNRTVTVAVTAVPGQVNITSTDATGQAMPPYSVNASHVTGVGGVSTFQFNPLGLRADSGGIDQILTVNNKQGLTYSVRVTGGGKASWCPRSTCP